MLLKEQVIEMADLFFNGNPEKAYTMVSDMNEWNQFINSIKKEENQDKAYLIMKHSDLDVWKNNTPFTKRKNYQSYDIGY
ncbi:hypothetical protein NH288_02870 [Anaerococcus sp. NML200537]|uniref:hypothetical protein n=1 Tax=Anaerococcus sp. NML200537 TaxID=2954485 RepID=UPI002238638F|nr:hypothetical protein [Anaerococcus sp. NML200537]MCW6701032.1 hypothetical protein [Anaerococcus sp. NML200537]